MTKKRLHFSINEGICLAEPKESQDMNSEQPVVTAICPFHQADLPL